MIALGTHHAMSEEAICERLEITLEERRGQYANVTFHNHEWDNEMLRNIGTIPAATIGELSGGRLRWRCRWKLTGRFTTTIRR